MVLSHPNFFLSFHRNPRSLLLSLSCICPIASLVAEKAEGKEGRTKAQKTELKSQMVNSTRKGLVEKEGGGERTDETLAVWAGYQVC